MRRIVQADGAPPGRPRPVFSLWVGAEPTALARASMASFAALGHPYTLYAYEPLAGLPAGVEFADADRVLPRKRVAYLLDRRAFSMVSNLFRYTALLDGGLWVDTDVLALRRFDFPDSQLVFGWESAVLVNTAVLGAPEGHPLVRELHRRTTGLRESFAIAVAEQRQTEERRYSRRLPARRRSALAAAQIVGVARRGRTYAHAAAPWGSFGPILVTRVANELGLIDQAFEPAAFYPIAHQDLEMLIAPGFVGEPPIPPGAYSVHAWNELLRRGGISQPPPGSLLERLVAPHISAAATSGASGAAGSDGR